MLKNIFWTFTVLVFLFNANSSIGVGPGLEEWKDENGRLAPPQVRKTADNLWDTVERCGAAAFSAGWGVRKKKPRSTEVRCCGLVMVDAYDPELDPLIRKLHESRHKKNYPLTYESDEIIYNQRKKEMMTALAEFKEAVNSSVSKPEQYSGDAKVCELGEWVEDGTDCYLAMYPSFVRARPDLSSVTQSVMTFVNSHGGWTSPYGTN